MSVDTQTRDRAPLDRDSALPPIPGVDPALDPRRVDPDAYRTGRLRCWWARILDPVELSAASSRWSWRPAVALATLYFVLGGTWVVVSSAFVSGSSLANPEILKGLGFVAATAIFFGALLLEYGRRARRSADRLRQLIESTGDLTFRYRIWPTVRFDYISEHVEQWMGLPATDYYEQPDLFVRHVHPDDRERFGHLIVSATTDVPSLIRWIAPDGRIFHSLIDLRAVIDRRGRMVAIDGRIRDVTESRRDRAESEVGAATLGRLASGDPLPQVIESVCAQVVELMGVEIAAVGLPLPDGSVELIASAGDSGAIDDVTIRWDEGQYADGPTGRCVQEHEPVVMTPDHPSYSAWRQRAVEAGVSSCLAVPIIRGGEVVATFTLWSRFGNPFDTANIGRFDRIARRLAFAVAQLPTRSSLIDDPARPSSPLMPPVDVRRALDEGRFEPWFQPQVDAEGRIVALEMLMRMRDEDGSVVAPNVVIPAAEAIGLMPAIGRSLRSTAIAQAAPWFELGLDRICLNVSVDELMSPGFIGELEDLITRDSVHAEQVEIELVETAPFDSAAQRVLGHVVEMGFRVAVDDYGSGWASLSHLSRLPAHVIKVDRVFVRDVAVSDRAKALVKSTFELGRSLDLITVAEGVETADQSALLVELGCDLMQGFLFSPPAPAEHIDALLRSGDRPFWPVIASALGRPTVV